MAELLNIVLDHWLLAILLVAAVYVCYLGPSQDSANVD